MPLTTTVVIPVRGHSDLLQDCLRAVFQQDHPVDEVLVVDDSDTGDLTSASLPAGVRVLRSHGVGPYAARNAGWRSCTADVVLFADARSRPRPTWSSRLLEHFEDPDVGFAGSDILVTSGRSLAARTAHRQQIFAVHRYLEGSAHEPYFPTCNLAVRRSQLERVEGFAVRRSGADADLCWRVLAGGATFAVTPDVLMDWVPRDGLRQHVEQFYRYGKSSGRLQREWADSGSAARTPASPGRLALRASKLALLLGASAVTRDGDAAVEHLVSVSNLAYDIGRRRSGDQNPPVVT